MAEKHEIYTGVSIDMKYLYKYTGRHRSSPFFGSFSYKGLIFKESAYIFFVKEIIEYDIEW